MKFSTAVEERSNKMTTSWTTTTTPPPATTTMADEYNETLADISRAIATTRIAKARGEVPDLAQRHVNFLAEHTETTTARRLLAPEDGDDTGIVNNRVEKAGASAPVTPESSKNSDELHDDTISAFGVAQAASSQVSGEDWDVANYIKRMWNARHLFRNDEAITDEAAATAELVSPPPVRALLAPASFDDDISSFAFSSNESAVLSVSKPTPCVPVAASLRRDDDGTDAGPQRNLFDGRDTSSSHARMKDPPPAPSNANNAKRKHHVLLEDDDEESKVAFCCKQCSCSVKRKVKAGLFRDNVPDYCKDFMDDNKVHRRCCHKKIQRDHEYYFVGVPDEPKKQKSQTRKRRVGVSVLQNKLATARAHETQYDADEALACNAFDTDTQYHENRKEFYGEVKEAPRKGGAVVIEFFAGVGSLMVILKRLGIPIRKSVRVEHGPVENFVYRCNHDSSFVDGIHQHDAGLSEDDLLSPSGEDLSFNDMQVPEDDGIEHQYFSSFEEIEADPEAFYKQIGALIDLIIGGPPCVDYSGSNASRKGTAGKQGSYMIRFAKLIHRLQALQAKHKIYFLAENTVIRNSKSKNKNFQDGDLTLINNAFGLEWDPIELDAREVSPCRRKRNLFTNLPYDGKSDADLAAVGAHVDSCLDPDGFRLAASWLDPVTAASCKVMTFMASEGRLNDSRMMVYRRIDSNRSRYESRPLNTEERERCMGLPAGYISEPLKYLFPRLLHHGYQPSPNRGPWTELLPRTLQKDFSGNFLPNHTDEPYKLRDGPDGRVLELASPPSGKDLSHFSEDEYAKHLIGNGFSVPQIEIVLRSLKQLFPPSQSQSYNGYPYPFSWQTGL